MTAERTPLRAYGEAEGRRAVEFLEGVQPDGEANFAFWEAVRGCAARHARPAPGTDGFATAEDRAACMRDKEALGVFYTKNGWRLDPARVVLLEDDYPDGDAGLLDPPGEEEEE